MAKRSKLVKSLWSEDELRLLKKLYRDTDTEKIADRFGRSVRSTKHKAYQMGLKKRIYWSKDEVELLKKLFPNRSAQDVADQLGRSLPSVTGKAMGMGLRKTKRYLKSLGRG